MKQPQLVLSLFTGLGLLDESFKRQGFCVVSAGDIISGQKIENFKGIKNKFDGIIGGSPCQDFSNLKPTNKKTNHSQEMIEHYQRVVKETEPKWWLHENVIGVPEIEIEGYNHQRIYINQSWYENVSRARIFQFGSKENLYLKIQPQKNKAGCESPALASDNRQFNEIKLLQGLPKDFDLPDFTLKAKKKLVGNAVPFSIGEKIAAAIKEIQNIKEIKTEKNFETKGHEQKKKYCLCGCGGEINTIRKYYKATCRKRYQRKKEKHI